MPDWKNWRLDVAVGCKLTFTAAFKVCEVECCWHVGLSGSQPRLYQHANLPQTTK